MLMVRKPRESGAYFESQLVRRWQILLLLFFILNFKNDKTGHLH